MTYLKVYGFAYSSPGDGGDIETEVRIYDKIIRELKAAAKLGEEIDNDYLISKYPKMETKILKSLQAVADECNRDAGYPDDEVHVGIYGSNIRELIYGEED